MPSLSTTPEVAAGSWLHNPVTGEVVRINAAPSETAGRRIEADLWLQPGAAVPRAHVHDHLVERYEVLSGELGFRLGDEERLLRPSDPAVEVPAGAVHDWWNAGDATAHVRFELEGTEGAPDRPAARFLSLIETMWSLAALGRASADGMPDRLWLAAVAREYRDVMRFTTPPAAVQAAVGGPLAAIARRSGRDPLAPELHGSDAPCRIPDPGTSGLEELLRRPVGARAARHQVG